MSARTWSAPWVPEGTAWRERFSSSAWTLRSAVALLLLATLAGAGLGVAMTSPGAIDPARQLLGAAVIIDGETARGSLLGLLGLEITLLGLVLSASTTTLYGLVSDQSLRLVPFLEPSRPLFRAALGLAITTGYVLGAVRRLGPAHAEAPRPVVTIGVAIALTTIVVVGVDAALSFRKHQLSQMLRVVTTATRRAIASQRARTRAWHGPGPGRVDGALIRAHRSGFVRDVDAASMLRELVRFDARARIDRTIGEYVVKGEPIGRVSDARAAEGVARAILQSESRSADHDVGAGLRVLADIAERALSPAVNDPYTACEVLFRARGLLGDLAAVPDGEWVLADESRTPRARIARPSFEEIVWLAVDGPCRYGAADPDVLDAVLDVARAIGAEPSRVQCARRLVERVLDDGRASGMSEARLERLDRKARAILRWSERATGPRLWSVAASDPSSEPS